jgi:hypothetical protein
MEWRPLNTSDDALHVEPLREDNVRSVQIEEVKLLIKSTQHNAVDGLRLYGYLADVRLADALHVACEYNGENKNK